MPATVVTFYSFKGGVGRTQALANVAVHLAARGKHVILVDMDLESPGVHFFFQHRSEDLSRGGVLEFLEECSEAPVAPPDVVGRLMPCETPLLRGSAGTIRLLVAGDLARDYAHRLARFSWGDFYARRDGYRCVEYMRDQLVNAGADFVLVDSRTGATDVGTVCTFQLPDTVAVFFALHEQGLFGAEQVVRAIKAPRESTDRARRVVVVPTRVEESGEDALRERWLARARDRFKDLADDFLGERDRRIPHTARASFGEYLVDLGDRDGSYLQGAYARLTDTLAGPGSAAVAEPSAMQLLRDCEAALAELDRAWAEITSESVSLGSLRTLSAKMEASTEVLSRRSAALDDVLRRTEGWLGDVAPAASELGSETRGDWTRRLKGLAARLASTIERSTARVEAVVRELVGPIQPESAGLAVARRRLRDGELAAFLVSWPATIEELRESSPRIALAMRPVDKAEFLRWTGGEHAPERVEMMLRDAMGRHIEAGALDAPTDDSTLLNLLRISIEMGVPPQPLHCSAYELALAVSNASLKARLRSSVGVWLWEHAWTSALDGPLSWQERVLSSSSALAPLEGPASQSPDGWGHATTLVADALTARRSAGGGEHVRGLLRRFPFEPGIARAVVAVRESDVAMDLVVTLLHEQNSKATPSPAVVGRFAELLAEENRIAEAFYVICREAERAPSLLDDERTPPVLAAFVWSARRRDATENLAELCAFPEFVALLATTPEGGLWLAWMLSGLDEKVWPEGVLATARRGLVEARSFEAAPQEIRKVVRERVAISSRDALRWADLKVEAEELLQRVSVHKTWGPATRYESAFRTYWRPRLKPLTDPTAPRSGRGIAIESASVVDVVRQARVEHPDTPEPVDAAMTSLTTYFDQMRRVAIEMRDIVDAVAEQDRAQFRTRSDDARAALSAFRECAERLRGRPAPPWRSADLHAVIFGGHA